MCLACFVILFEAKAAARVWGCTVASLRKPTATRHLKQNSPVLPLACLRKRSLKLQSPVAAEEGFRFFWSVYRDKLPSDLDDLLRLPDIWFCGWSPLLPLLALLKYRPIREQPGTQTQSLRLRVHAVRAR